MRFAGRGIAIAALCALFGETAMAEEGDAELAKKAENPGASLTSVPFQHNWDCCFGSNSAHRYLLNIEPVIPFKLNDDWHLITRTVIPFSSTGSTAPGVGSQTGLGDVTQTFFLVPQLASGMTLGVGPILQWATGTPDIGSQKYGAGPALLAVKQHENWTYGVLTNHIWSYAGADNRDPVSNTLLQPFVSYTFPDTTSISLNTETNYDWVQRQWLVPVNLSVGKIVKFGDQPVKLALTGRYYVVRPDDGPTWGMRFTSTFLFPGR